jgi:hypothetical protein
MAAPRVLFLGHNKVDYLADGLFHGLRSVLGPAALDYPKREIAYAGYPPEALRRLRGHGFGLYGLLEDLSLDRTEVPARLARGEFDLVVVGDIWRDFGFYIEALRPLQRLGAVGRTRVALVDGTDSPALYPNGRRFWRVPAWWGLPRAQTRFPYYKREWRGWTATFRSYGAVPPFVPGAARRLRNIRPIAFSFPAEKTLDQPPPKTKDWPLHVVDAEVAKHVGAHTYYAFDAEEDYYADLRASRFGVTTKRAGWDCLRHYEIAANGAVPCFRALQRKPATNAPHGLDASNSISYRSWGDLRRQVEALSDQRYRELQQGALRWARANSTRERAAGFLQSMGLPA